MNSKHTKMKKFNFNFKAIPFWVYYVIIVITVLGFLFIAGFITGRNFQYKNDTIVLNQTIQEAEEKYAEMVAHYENLITAEETKIYSEAEYVAKLLYGQARMNSPEAQRAIAWLVINRVENSQFPNSVQEVVQQEYQWMGYSDDNIIEQDIYNIALDVITDWHNGSYRPISADFLYMTWSQVGVSLRTEFVETPATQYLHFK